MFPTTNYQPLILVCLFWDDSAQAFVLGAIEDADNDQETAKVNRENTCFVQTISFAQIANVFLSYGFHGERLQTFGPPRPHRPVFPVSIPTRAGVK